MAFALRVLSLDGSEAPTGQDPDFAHVLAIAAALDLVPQDLPDFGIKQMEPS